MATRLERYHNMFSDLGQVRMLGWRPSPDGEGITVVGKGAQGENVTLNFSIEKESPYRFRGVGISVG